MMADEPAEKPAEEPVEELSAFRKMLAHDNESVFLNLAEFGETHTIEGNDVRCVVDDDIHGKAAGAHDYGITDTTFTLFVRVCDLDRSLAGDQLEYDGKLYTVADWRTDEGMHRVTLRKPATY